MYEICFFSKNYIIYTLKSNRSSPSQGKRRKASCDVFILANRPKIIERTNELGEKNEMCYGKQSPRCP